MLNWCKHLRWSLTAHTTVNGEILEPSPRRSGTRHKRPLSPLLSNTVLARATRQEKNKRHQNWKRVSKISLTEDDMIKIPHIQKNPTRTNKWKRPCCRLQNQHKNRLCFYMLTINNLKGELRKQPHHSGIRKSKTPRNKFIPWGDRLVHKQNILQRPRDTNKWKDVLCSQMVKMSTRPKVTQI